MAPRFSKHAIRGNSRKRSAFAFIRVEILFSPVRGSEADLRKSAFIRVEIFPSPQWRSGDHHYPRSRSFPPLVVTSTSPPRISRTRSTPTFHFLPFTSSLALSATFPAARRPRRHRATGGMEFRPTSPRRPKTKDQRPSTKHPEHADQGPGTTHFLPPHAA